MLLRALLAVMLALCGGCVKNFNQNPPLNLGLDFFACNYWIDRNQDGKIDIDEWEGIKDCFLENEHISFVAYFRQKPGTSISFKLIAPDGSLYREKSLKQTAKITIWCQEYEAKNLIGEKGSGIWKMEWYAGEQLVNITYIKVTKFPSD